MTGFGDAPGGVRPGQVSILLLGRVIIGDIAVTLVDLARRGLLTVPGGRRRLAAHPESLGRGGLGTELRTQAAGRPGARGNARPAVVAGSRLRQAHGHGTI